MCFRKNVTVPGIPFLWNTALSDDEIRRLYSDLMVKLGFGPWVEPPKKGHSLEVTTRGLLDLPFDGAYCRCFRLGSEMFAVRVSTENHERYHAAMRERFEKETAEKHEWEAEALLLSIEDSRLSELTNLAIDAGEYDEAERYFYERTSLENRTGTDREHLLFKGNFVFALFPTSKPGMRLIKHRGMRPHLVREFADRYFFDNQSAGENKDAEMDRIFQDAIHSCPDDGLMYKEAVLFWRRRENLSRAIRYCELAIAKGLDDNTKSGFQGRLGRLRREAEREASQ